MTIGTFRQPQRGQVVVLFALALIAMLAMVGVALDGGTLYVQRRTAQNAADAAALAGTRALQQTAYSPTYTIAAEICKYALANSFGVTPSASAYFVNTSGTSLGTISLPANCSGSANNVIPTGTSGVHVDVTIGPYNTLLAGLVGLRQLQAQASATAQVGLLTIPAGEVPPLAGCGPDMLTDGRSSTPSVNILNVDNLTVNQNTPPVGTDLVLQGSQMAQNVGSSCPTWNGSSAWKGVIDPSGLSGNLAFPTSVPVVTGNRNIDGSMTSICTTIYGPTHDPVGVHSVPPDVCLLLIPVAAPPNSGNNANIVTLACFSVYDGQQGYQKWRGVLHQTSDCKYGIYPPTWTWGNSNQNTQVMLTS